MRAQCHQHTIQTSKLDDYEVVVSLDIVSLFIKFLYVKALNYTVDLLYSTKLKGFKGSNFANTSKELQTD